MPKLTVKSRDSSHYHIDIDQILLFYVTVTLAGLALNFNFFCLLQLTELYKLPDVDTTVSYDDNRAYNTQT